jgi:RNA 3'-terminal phosphate cyclase (ATP)
MSVHEAVVIDGAHGEGGGQIIRTTLSLAMITGRPCRLVNVRANRSRPGLRPQHLTAVQASASVCNARVIGARLGSHEFSFTPGPLQAKAYKFDIGTAGAATLVLQTLLPALSRAGGESILSLTGGTHVPWSPPFHYLDQVFLPTIAKLGFKCTATLKRWGWYPKGGGEIAAVIRTAGSPAAVSLDQPFVLERLSGISASSRLPEQVRVRQRLRIQSLLQGVGTDADIPLLDVSALSPGSFVFLCAYGKESVAGFSSLGVRGKPAERVADDTAEALFHFMDSGSAVDPFLADQILIYLAMLPGRQEITTSAISKHLLTNAWVVEQFLPVRFMVTGDLDRPGLVVKGDR